MERTFTAVYENGVLRPLTDLPFAQHERVTLQIVTEPSEPGDTHPLMALAGLGKSGEQDVSMRAEEILSAEIDPRAGWTVSDDRDR